MAFNSQPLRDFLAAQKAVEDLKPSVGPTLRAMRLNAGLTQTFVATNAGVPQALLSQYENEAKTPSSDSLTRIIDVMEGSTGAGSSEDEGQEGAPEEEGH
jgi:transcriptional regulator with XRE-family HTH domain